MIFFGLGRVVGFVVVGVVFSWGVQRGYMIVVWWFLGLIVLMGMILFWFIIEGDGFIVFLIVILIFIFDGEEESLFQCDDDDDSSVDGYDEVVVLEVLEGEELELEIEFGKERKKRIMNGSYGIMNNGIVS